MNKSTIPSVSEFFTFYFAVACVSFIMSILVLVAKSVLFLDEVFTHLNMFGDNKYDQKLVYKVDSINYKYGGK